METSVKYTEACELAESARHRFGPGIYLHFPFCSSRCGYCDFFVVLGEEEARRTFVDDLLLEIDLAAEDGRFEGVQFQTLFIGGGTPSLLEGAQMDRVLSRLRAKFGWAESPEITVECNPDSIDPDKIRAYQASGINRVSLGVQSMDEDELDLLDRRHDVDQVRRRVGELREAGIEDLSLDLIYGLPGTDRSVQSWERTLGAVLALEPDHLSSYLLSLEPHVPLARKVRIGEAVLPEDESAETQYRILLERTAAAGFESYEISNFARPGHQSRHNQNYWLRGDYLGLGPSAHSHRRGARWANPRSLTGYGRAVREGSLPWTEPEEVDAEGIWAEWIFLGLRRREGVDQSILEGMLEPASQQRFKEKSSQLVRAGMLEQVGPNLRLTDRACFVSNAVFGELLEAW